MEKTKVIKGTPIYVYKGTLYAEPIKGLKYGKMLYNDKDNCTLVHMKRYSILLDVLCLTIILLCVLLNTLYIHKYSIDCNYNSVVNYYDNHLYLNWNNPVTNKNKLKYELLYDDDVIYDCILNPGESIIRIPYNNPYDTYTCRISTKALGLNKEQVVDIKIINRE